ncbi:MAG: DUF4139 domain-containing protein [Planctomycetaceae bacterium]|nr:DUF4139 domain-containing protein [Planctomycetaceae bacterium]
MLRIGICALGLLIVSSAAAEERSLDLSLNSLALFKNGLACVEYAGEVSEGGTYRIENLPDAVHGTFWVESSTNVTVRITRRSVDLAFSEAFPTDFQQDLAGREVVVRFKEPHLEPVSGKVVGPSGQKPSKHDYESSEYRRRLTVGMAYPGSLTASMLALETAGGLTFFDRSTIAAVEVPGGIQVVSCERPVMLLDVSPEQKKPISIVIWSLTRGVAWAPSYQIDVSDPATLAIRQSAVIKNELAPIRNADIRLISGFPSVHFANVLSPMSPETTWNQFFQQLSQPHRGTDRAVMSQLVAVNATDPEQGIDLSAVPMGEGADLHFESIGRRTLDVGDSLTLQTAAAKADYERIVEWIIPDARLADGRLGGNRDSKSDEDLPWDALRFRNPLGFPMTTAPAMIVADGRFLGQQISQWVNAGEQTTLRVNKALSIRTLSSEHEVEGQRAGYEAYGRMYRKAKVQAEVLANNHRNERVTLVIRKRFSGELISAEGEPKTRLREEGAWSINPRNELIWTVDLAPGEEVRFVCTYTVLAS